MLSLFPQILFLAPFSALVIRIALGVIFAYSAWQHLRRADLLPRLWAIGEIAVGIALLLGIYTQGFGLVGFLGVALATAFPRLRVYPRSTTLLTLVMLASLVVTGAGALAFDLPL